jgi:hypothetical protein
MSNFWLHIKSLNNVNNKFTGNRKKIPNHEEAYNLYSHEKTMHLRKNCFFLPADLQPYSLPDIL